MKRKTKKNYIKNQIKKSTIKLWAYVTREKYQNHCWVFTIGDADDNPSVPHAHSKEKGYRLDVWSGKIYPAGNDRNTVIGKLNKKELQRLHKDKKFIDFAVKQINWYRNKYPYTSFSVPEWFESAYMRKKQVAFQKKDNSPSVYVFLGRAQLINRDSQL